MSEPATINQVAQIGVQADAGTAVPATRRLQSVAVAPSVAVETVAVRGGDGKFSSTVALTKEWSTVAIEGTPDYRELAYLLAACIGNVHSGPVGDNRFYEFRVRHRGSDVVLPLTVQRGTVGGTALETSDVTLSGFTLSWRRSNGSATVNATGFGTPITPTTLTGDSTVTLTTTGSPTSGTFIATIGFDGSAATYTTDPIPYNATAAQVAAALMAAQPDDPTYPALDAVITGAGGPLGTSPVTVTFGGGAAQRTVTVPALVATFDTGDVSSTITQTPAQVLGSVTPILPQHVTVSINDTPLPRAMSVDIEVADRFNPVWYLDNGPSFSSTVEAEPSITVKLVVAVEGGLGLLDTIRTGATVEFALLAEAAGNQFAVTLNAAVETVDQFSDEDGVYAIGYTLRVVADSGGDGNLFFLTNSGIPELD